MNTLLHKQRLQELKDRSILTWLDQEVQNSIIDHFEFRTVESGQSINDQLDEKSFVILLSGRAQISSKVGHQIKETITPGRSFELDSFLLEKSHSYQWTAEEEVVVAYIEFEILKSFLVSNNKFEYLKKITTSIELQRFKNDLIKLRVDKDLTVAIISSLQKSTEPPQAEELCIISSGTIDFLHPTKGTELKHLQISDYFLLRNTDLPLMRLNDLVLWKLPRSFEIEKKIDPSTYSFLFIFWDLEEKLRNFGEINSETFDEPEEDDGFDIPHFKKTNESNLLPRKQKPVLLRQHDSMDCGAACMAMISKHYGRNINISTWRRLIHITREGASMLSIKLAAEKVGFDAIGVMSGTKSLSSFTTPFIAVMEYHFVVVYEINETTATFADPARGIITASVEDFKKEYSNNALLIRPNQKLLTYPESPSTYKKYFGLFKPHLGDFIQLFLFSCLLFFLSLAPPLFTQYIFDSVLPVGGSESLNFVTYSVVFFLVILMILSVVRFSFLVKIASIVSLKLSSLFFRQVLRLPYGYFSVRNVGDIVTRVEELEKIRTFFTERSIQLALSVMAILVYSGILLIYHPFFSYLILFSILISTLVMTPIFRKTKNQLLDLFVNVGKTNSVIFEQFNALKTIQGLTGEVQARWRWEEKQGAVLEKRQKFQNLNATAMSISTLMQQLISLSFLSLAVYLFMDRKITIGQAVAAITISGLIIGPILDLIRSVDDIGQLKVSFEKIDEIVTSKIENSNANESFPAEFKTIEFKDLWFKYGSDFGPWTLKGISLEFRRGQKIAFVGPSGSGKSTLSYMLNLIYEAQKGRVLIGELDNASINLEELRSHISMIVQDNSILEGTVLYNISLGDPTPDLQRAIEAARLAEAQDFIMALPFGYQTMIGGQHGSSMSGGEKQRLCIARAIYKSPSILIMDEATSALDSITEKKVMNNILQELKNTTCFIIAHRLNSIITSDVIVVVNDGKIEEQGTHGELMRKQGTYYDMFRRQTSL